MNRLQYELQMAGYESVDSCCDFDGEMYLECDGETLPVTLAIQYGFLIDDGAYAVLN